MQLLLWLTAEETPDSGVRQSACEKGCDPLNKAILEMGGTQNLVTLGREYFGFTAGWLGGAKFPTGLQLVRDSTCLYQSLTGASLTFELKTAPFSATVLWPLNSSDTPPIYKDFRFNRQKRSQFFDDSQESGL